MPLGKKQLFFSLVPAAFVLGILVLIEVCLRLFMPSLVQPLVESTSRDGIVWYQVNRRYLEKYFPANTVLVPELKPSLFRETKTSETFRVFCLGESSMFGTPYQMTATIPALIRRQLRILLPDRDVEVINFGAAAINTNVIADMAEELSRFHPDLVVLYTGHNEFYGPDGVGASWLEKRFPFLTPLKYRLRDIRLVRLMGRLLTSITPRPQAADAGNLMKAVSQGAHVRLESEEANRIFSLSESNVATIIDTFTKHHIPIIVSDVSSNLLFPPFASDSCAGLDALRHEYEAGLYSEAESGLRSLATAVPTNALVNFWLGKTLLALGKGDSARLYLTMARDWDLLKFRAPSQINEIVRRVAWARGAPLVSADSLFEAISPNRIPGNNVFWEHLHPRAYGYYRIAELFVDEMEAEHLLPLSVPVAFRRLPYNVDSLHIAWLDEAYADLAMKHLTSQWPFIDYVASPAVIDSSDQALVAIAQDVYRHVTDWNQGLVMTAEYFQRHGEIPKAVTTYCALVDEYPFNAQLYAYLGGLYRDEDDLTNASASYQRALALSPDALLPSVDLGLIEINKGNVDRALGLLTHALRLTNANTPREVRATILYGLSAASANRGDYQRAREYVEQSLQLLPTYDAALQLRSRLAQVR